MVTLYELGQEAVKIREAVNSIEVKGRQNAALIVYCCEKCDNIVKAINEAAASVSVLSREDEAPEDDQPAETSPPEGEGEKNE